MKKVIIGLLFLGIFGYNSYAQTIGVDYELLLVKLSTESKYSIITSKTGYQINVFANKLETAPIILNRTYSRYSVAFFHSEKLEQLAEKLDINNDYKIDLEELFKIY